MKSKATQFTQIQLYKIGWESLRFIIIKKQKLCDDIRKGITDIFEILM